jgi:hypothetical protein
MIKTNKMKPGLIVTLLFGVFAFVACTETTSDEFCSNPGQTCPDNSAIEATACCTNEDCHWVYNGVNYDCNGDDCTSAIDAIVASACTSKSALINVNETNYEVLKAQMQSVTAQLLIEAREASGCVN